MVTVVVAEKVEVMELAMVVVEVAIWVEVVKEMGCQVKVEAAG